MTTSQHLSKQPSQPLVQIAGDTHRVPSSYLPQFAMAADKQSYIPLLEAFFSDSLTTRGDWNLSVYDMAWVLSSDFFEGDEKERRLDELLQQQHPDGTWGDASYAPHSALVDTLAVAMALVRTQRSVPRFEALKARVNELVLACRDYTHHDTVAFELIAPMLVDWLDLHGVNFDLSEEAKSYLIDIGTIGQRKLFFLANIYGLFSPATTVSYTAEFAAFLELTEQQLDELLNLMLPNGGIGLAPAATAAIIVVLREYGRPVPQELYQYLQTTLDAYQGRGFPDLYPASNSRRLWTLLPWILSGHIHELMAQPRLLRLFKRIYQDITFDDRGTVAWDVNNAPLADLDDTAVSFALYSLLRHKGIDDIRPMDYTAFRHFQRPDGSFFCYPLELHPSPAALLHTVMSLDIAGSVFGPAFAHDSVTASYMSHLLRDLTPQTYDFEKLVHDKWHATWAYGAQRWLSVKRIQQHFPDLVLRLTNDTLERQQAGGWGQHAPTLEETAYVVSGLYSVLRSSILQPSFDLRTRMVSALDQAQVFMYEQSQAQPIHLPHIWISKNLYIAEYWTVSAIGDAVYSYC